MPEKKRRPSRKDQERTSPDSESGPRGGPTQQTMPRSRQSKPGGQANPKQASSGEPKSLEAFSSDMKNTLPVVETFPIPKRKSSGTLGRPIKLLSNHFKVEIKCEELYLYQVTFTSSIWKHGPRKSDELLLYRAFHELKNTNRDHFPDLYGVIFNGNDCAAAAKKLFNGSPIFRGTVEVPEMIDVPQQKVTVTIELKYSSSILIKDAIYKFCSNGRTATRPADVIMWINAIMTNNSKLTKISIGRNVFHPNTEGKIIGQDGKNLWQGVFTTFRPGWKPFVVVDLANKPAYNEQEALNFICESVLKSKKLLNWGPFETTKIAKALHKVKVRYNRPDGQKRDYRCNDKMGPRGSDPRGVDHNGSSTSIAEYFRSTYNYKLKYPELPTIWVGSKNKTMFLPIELLVIKKQACPLSKRLDEKETSDMIRFTAVPPEKRRSLIRETFNELKDKAFAYDPFAKSFGISVADHFSPVNGRVLNAPKVGYSNGDVHVRDGKWSINKGNYRFVDGQNLQFWAIFDTCCINDEQKKRFVSTLKSDGNSSGLRLSDPVFRYSYVDSKPNKFEESFNEAKKCFEALLKRILEVCGKNNSKPLILVIVKDKSSPIRHRLKFIGDCENGVPTQFILSKHVQEAKPQLAHNIVIKMNSKLGGTNQIISHVFRPKVFQNPVMLLGADVTHPSPDTPKERKVSIAAMVGSTDPNGAIYNGGQVVEMIEDGQSMVRNLLLKFYQTTRQKPFRIIYYRDGVSEGQFQEVLNMELAAIRNACSSLESNYKPGITMLVVQKRHKTRLFPQSPSDGIGRMKNIPPGTVVDTEIVHPTEQNFFLASHEGIQGTTRPTNYHLLWDDNNFSGDDLQTMTYYLTHLYSRCERSVSLPAPTYYSHLAAFRARDYLQAIQDRLGQNAIPGNAEYERLCSLMTSINLLNFFV